MNKYLNLAFISLVLINSLSCSKTVEIIKYRMSSEEESSFKFEKITSDNDNLSYFINAAGIRGLNSSPFDLSKDGSLIAFQSFTKSGENNLYIKNLSKLNVKQQRTFNGTSLYPKLSPDSKQLAFCSIKNQSLKLFLIGAEEGSMTRQVTNSDSSVIDPVFFNDGKKILYSESNVSSSNTLIFKEEDKSKSFNYYSYDWYLWSFDLEKGAYIQYGKGYEADFFPKDNENKLDKVVTIRNVINTNDENNNNKTEIWILELESGKEFLLLPSENDRNYRHPSVSPDGKKIAFTMISKGKDDKYNHDIYIINSDGSNLQQITYHQGIDSYPKWSVDGKSLYFLSQRGADSNTYNIWKLNLKSIY